MAVGTGKQRRMGRMLKGDVTGFPGVKDNINGSFMAFSAILLGTEGGTAVMAAAT